MALWPEGEGELVLELAVDNVSASLRAERVILATAAGRPLAYGKLVLVDATVSQEYKSEAGLMATGRATGDRDIVSKGHSPEGRASLCLRSLPGTDGRGDALIDELGRI